MLPHFIFTLNSPRSKFSDELLCFNHSTEPCILARVGSIGHLGETENVHLSKEVRKNISLLESTVFLPNGVNICQIASLMIIEYFVNGHGHPKSYHLDYDMDGS